MNLNQIKLIYLNGDNHLNNQTEVINVKIQFKKEIKQMKNGTIKH